jgi:hypothetical protein
MIRTTNDVVRTLLIQASLPPRFRAESLHTATYLLNRLPSTASPTPTPHHALFGTPPLYDHLRVFGCACYPNTSATASHKLAPRSTRCVFLGYSPDHKGYRCLDHTSRRVLISRHVVFDESDFPYSTSSTPSPDPELETLFPTDPVVQPPLPVCPFPLGFPGTPAPFPVIPAAPSAAPVPAVTPRRSPDLRSCRARTRCLPLRHARPRCLHVHLRGTPSRCRCTGVARRRPRHHSGTLSRCRCTGVVQRRHWRRLLLRRLRCRRRSRRRRRRLLRLPLEPSRRYTTRLSSIGILGISIPW